MTQEFDSRHGGLFNLSVYRNTITQAEHVALVKGDIVDGAPVPVRVHALSVLDDVLSDRTQGRGGELQEAMDLVGQEGRGVVVLIRDPSPVSISERLKNRGGQDSIPSTELRDYGEGAQILLDLGVREMILLHNTRHTIVGLEGYGLKVVGQKAVRPAQ
ncbi:hypothetical protein [Fodinicurvata halophila]